MYAGLYILHLPRSHDGLLVPGLHRVAVLLAIWVEVMTLVLLAFLAIRTYRDDTGIENKRRRSKKKRIALVEKKTGQVSKPCIYIGCKYS